MMSRPEQLAVTATDFKNLLIDSLSSENMSLNISQMARAVGVDPSTMNRYINSPKSHLPSYLIPHIPDELRSTLLHWLDNRSGNPIKGHIDTSELDGSVRDECDRIIWLLGCFVNMERTKPGTRCRMEKVILLQGIGRLVQRAEMEIESRG